MSNVVVKYTDIAVGAKETFEITAGGNLPASNVELIKKDNIEYLRYDTPFDLNSMLLDGNAKFLPENEMAQIGYISEQISNGEAIFETPIVIEFNSAKTYTSIGIALAFDELKNIYSTHLNIKWYNGEILLDNKDFYPTRAYYFCDNKVQYYNKVIITFYSLNVPYNRLRLNNIDYGIKVEFTANELTKAKIIQEIDAISTSIPISPFDFSINSNKNIEFSFQPKQPIEVYVNNKLKACTFIKSAKRKSKNVWDIKSEDYIGLLDSIYFKGGIYTNKNAVELLQEIFLVAKIPYSISDIFNNIELTGYIPYTTCREALMQVCFAISAIVNTSNSDKINIVKLNNETTRHILANKIMQGQSFQDETRVTAVELTSHTYIASTNSNIIYDSSKSGVGENIFVIFSEPFHTLTISNGSIVESGVNYAIINANDGCILNGKTYEHTKVIHRKENPFVLSEDIQNVIAIDNATLVSTNNVDNLLQLCYNYLVKTEQTNMKIIDGKNENFTSVGDMITFDTEYLGEKTGRIIKQTFDLGGGILVKDSVVR
jgi:hypothetical protein